MKILVTGSRNWTNKERIREALLELRPLPQILIHGAARGADTLAAEVGEELGIKTVAYPADWDHYKKGAGTIRNIKMLSENPDIALVLAFHNDLPSSKGTKHMVTIALKDRKAVILYREKTKTIFGLGDLGTLVEKDLMGRFKRAPQPR